MPKEKKPPEKEAVIAGYIEELDLDDGSVGVQIVAGEEEYRVIMDRYGKELLDLIDEKIQATGMISVERGVRRIKIAEFQILDDYAESEDAEMDYDEDQDDDRDR
jgi:hypothetical protein